MTLANQTSTVTHNGNGATTVWPYTFIIPDAASARVGLFEIATNVLTELAETAYSITGLNDANGGEVTYPLIGSAISSAFRLVIWRAVNYTQDTDLTNQTPYYPTVLEGQLDRIVMQIQQLSGETDRALKVTQGSALDPDTFIAQLQSGAAVATAQAGIATAQATAAAASAASIDPGNLVHYTAETKTAAQQGQARANVGAGVLAGFRNKLRNGQFLIAQRGTSFVIAAGSAAFTADGWLVNNTTNQSVTVTVNDRNAGFSEALVPEASQGYLNLAFSVAPTSGEVYILQRIEGVETLAGQVATLTMYTNSSVANADGLTWYAVQNFGTGGSPNADVVTQGTLNIGSIYNAGTRKRTGTVSVPSIAGKTFGSNKNDRLELSIALSPRNAISYQIDRVSLVPGDATAEADPFSPRHIQQERALCRWYYDEYELTFSGRTVNGAAYRVRGNHNMRANPFIAASVVSHIGFSTTIASAAATATSALVVVTATSATDAADYTVLVKLDAEF